MKFLPTFLAMLVVTFVADFLFASLLAESYYGRLVVIALLGAILICAYMEQSNRTDALEKRIQELEADKTAPEDT